MARGTVLTTVFNGAPYVERYCETLRASADQDLVWMLIDDGCTDGTIEKVRERLGALGLLDRLRVLQPGRLGFHKALNHGIVQVDTEIIFRHDFDDESWPVRFTSQLALLDAEPELALVGGGYVHAWPDRGQHEMRSQDFDYERFLRHFPLYVPFPHTFMAYRTDAVRAAGSYPDWDDYEEMGLIGRLIAAGHRIGAVTEVVGRHFVYQASFFESRRPYAVRRFRVCLRQLQMRREFGFVRPGRLAIGARFAYSFLPGPIKYAIRRAVGYAA